MRPSVHLILHFLVPAIIALLFYRERMWRAWLIMCGTMLVDIDHLFAEPVYDPGRCSIGFHLLHRYPMIFGYAAAAAVPRLRLVATGLLVHMALDGVDCVWMSYE